MSYSNMTPISTPSPEEMYKRYTSIEAMNDPRIDEVLKHAMTGGNPNFPGIYATMALDARNNNRAQAKFQQAQQQTQQQGRQPTVVDHIIAQAPVEQRLTQGMGSLPVDESTFHAAGGGMVSFAHGGGMSGRGDMHDSAEHKKLVKKAAEAKAKAIAEWGAGQTGYNFPSEYVSPAGDGISSPEMNAMIDDASRRQNPTAPDAFSPEQMQALGQSQGAPEQQGVDPNAAAVARTRSMYNVAPPASEGIVDLPAAGRGRVIGGAEHYRNAVGPDKAPAPATSPTAFSPAQQQALMDYGRGLNTQTGGALAPSDKAADASTSKGFPPLSPEEKKRIRALSGSDLKKDTKKDIKKGADKGITALKPNVTQAEKDIAAETAARYHKMVGEDPDAADRKARMEALGLSNAEAKRRAPWMALANAGFGMMAGESQYAMQNIGAGAQQGLAHLSESQKDIARAQERHAAMQDAIGERDYARRAKGAELGMTTEAASKKATQDESQFARDIASRERVAAITAAGMQSRIGAQEAGIALRGLDSDLKLAHSELILATTKKEKDAINARIANIMARKNQITGMIDMQTAGAPVGGSLVADKSGMMNYTPAS